MLRGVRGGRIFPLLDSIRDRAEFNCASDDGQLVFQCSFETLQVGGGIEDKAGADIGSVCGTLPDDTDLTPFVRLGFQSVFPAEKTDVTVIVRAEARFLNGFERHGTKGVTKNNQTLVGDDVFHLLKLGGVTQHVEGRDSAEQQDNQQDVRLGLQSAAGYRGVVRQIICSC